MAYGFNKTCKRCGRSLPATKRYFNENKSSKDGLQSYCRSCQKKQNAGDKMKEMRKGAPKPRKPRIPRPPQFTPEKLMRGIKRK